MAFNSKIKLATSVVVALATLAGSGAAVAHEPGKLLLWINGDKAYNGIQKVGDAHKKKTNVPVVVEHPEDAPSKFQSAAAAGKGPDVWCWPHDRIGEWIQGGLLEELKPSAKVKSEIVNVAWDAFTVDGKVYGYPLSVESIGLIYNKKLISTPPKTFEEIPALHEKLMKEKGVGAILWDYNNTYFSWPLLAANGGYAFAKDAKGNFNPKDTGVANDGAKKGAQVIVDLINKGVMAKGASYADMEAAMNKGKIAMMISGPWAWDNLKNSKIDFGVAPIPSIGGKPGKPFVGVLGCMINKSSPNKAAAVKFLEESLLRPENLKTVNADVPLGTPANKAFFKELYADANVRATMANVNNGKPMPSNPEMGKFWSAMASALQNITQGRQTVDAGLNNAAKRITK